MYRNLTTLVQAIVTEQYMYSLGHLASYKYNCRVHNEIQYTSGVKYINSQNRTQLVKAGRPNKKARTLTYNYEKHREIPESKHAHRQYIY